MSINSQKTFYQYVLQIVSKKFIWVQSISTTHVLREGDKEWSKGGGGERNIENGGGGSRVDYSE